MSIGISKASCKHSCEKCLSPSTGNFSLDESDASIRTTDMNINGNSYVNTPSPSSIASTSSNDRSFKYRSKGTQKEKKAFLSIFLIIIDSFYAQISSKRRYRNDKLFRLSHSLNHQYVITMTNLLFQMQKEIHKLKRRTHHVEQMLANQIQSGRPIIRIPRLTRGKIEKTNLNRFLIYFLFQMIFQPYVLMIIIMKKK